MNTPVTNPGQTPAIRPVRPWVVTVVGWFFVAVGCVSLVAGLWRFIGDVNQDLPGSSFHSFTDIGLVVLTAVAAAVGGVFVLRGQNWARWLIVVWMGLHVILSFFHTRSELVVHGLFLVILLVVLGGRRASGYFRAAA